MPSGGRGDALAEVVLSATKVPERSVVGGDRALIMVTISLEELERRAGEAFIEGIGYTSVAHLRRLVCDANVVPTVLGTRGEVLDLGRARRTEMAGSGAGPDPQCCPCASAGAGRLKPAHHNHKPKPNREPKEHPW
jgi:hypothetical protein